MYLLKRRLAASLSADEEAERGETVAPASVNVANRYSASVDPASECAAIRRLYQVPENKSDTVYESRSGFTVLDERIHSFDPCCLYWITKLLIGQELDFQADRCNVIYEELIVTKDVLSGATGAGVASSFTAA